MKKLLTIVVPSYNAEEYLKRTILSLRPDDTRVEILIINDGSVDKTATIAEALAQQFPKTIKVIHQENKGHGGAINTGMKFAQGAYFKVVDSDDWLDTEAFAILLDRLTALSNDKQTIDMLICNFVYEKEGATKKKVVRYDNVFPLEEMFGWDAVKKMRLGQYLLMHSVIYKTALLQSIELTLPEHTFYVDNLFAYLPLQHIETMYYLNIDLYRYYTGREGQSVQLDIMLNRIMQQVRVNKMMLDGVKLDAIENKPLRDFLLHYLKTVTMVSQVLLTLKKDDESNIEKTEIWEHIKQTQPNQHKKMRYSLLGRILHRTDKIGYFLVAYGYQITHKMIGFN